MGTGFPTIDKALKEQMEGRQHRGPVIQTGLQSLDYECKLGGHLIVLIGHTASGKTTIMNTIKSTARKNHKTCFHVWEGVDFNEMKVRIDDLIQRPSEIKLIEWSGVLTDDTKWVRKLREQLVANNQWAVISAPTNRNGIGKKNVIDCAPSSLVRMADYVFSLHKDAIDISNVVNIKNRYRSESRRTSCFPIRFKQCNLTKPSTVIAEEINTPDWSTLAD